VKSGDIEIISSDHSPAPPDMKELESGDFMKAWGGISGVAALALSLRLLDPGLRHL